MLKEDGHGEERQEADLSHVRGRWEWGRSVVSPLGGQGGRAAG